ncbi:hypothetical protein [Methanospirillum sp.]|nr:hypothetical protein [Methanospirillum sp.]
MMGVINSATGRVNPLWKDDGLVKYMTCVVSRYSDGLAHQNV